MPPRLKCIADKAWDFLDDAGRPRHLRFRRNLAPPGDSRVFAETGQLVAIIGDDGRADNSGELAISGPNVSYAAIQAALEGWERSGPWCLMPALTVGSALPRSSAA